MSHALPIAVVLDTQVWLDMLWFQDPRCERLRADLQTQRLQAFVREDVCAEWRRVLEYPQLAIAAEARLQLQHQFETLTRALPALSRDQHLAQPKLPRCADADDQKFLELARDCAARFLFSRDHALLNWSRRSQAALGLRILSPDIYRSLPN